MDVILLKDYLSLGKTGDTVKVKPGFARNFLIPEGIALRASSKNLSIFKKFESVDLQTMQLEKTECLKIARANRGFFLHSILTCDNRPKSQRVGYMSSKRAISKRKIQTGASFSRFFSDSVFSTEDQVEKQHS